MIAVIDWFSRKVPACSTVSTMDSLHCVETLETAIAKYGEPEIFKMERFWWPLKHEDLKIREHVSVPRLKVWGMFIIMQGRLRLSFD